TRVPGAGACDPRPGYVHCRGSGGTAAGRILHSRGCCMKLLLFNDSRLGVLKGDHVVDVSSTAPRADGLGVSDLAAQAVIEQVIEGFASYGPKFEEIAAREAGVPLASVKVQP